MRESRPYGSERGAFSNGRPYRDRTSNLRSVGIVLWGRFRFWSSCFVDRIALGGELHRVDFVLPQPARRPGRQDLRRRAQANRAWIGCHHAGDRDRIALRVGPAVGIVERRCSAGRDRLPIIAKPD